MKRRALAAASGLAALALATTAFAQGPTEKVRKLNLYSWPQAALPQELPGRAADRPGMAQARPRRRRQAAAAPGADRAHLVQPRQVGHHDVAHGRPARALRSRRVRLQPLPLELRREGLQLRRLHQPRLRQARREAAHPARPRGAAQDRLRGAEDHRPRPAATPSWSIRSTRSPSTRRSARRTRSSTRAGIGIRNIWTFVGIEPLGAQKDLIINSTEAINAINPLYIGGAVDSWVTDLIWDRLMRIGPDGLPQPWAAESVTWVDDKTLDVKLRAGMKWHDGKPVTVDDVIFSFQAPAGDKAPMYKPFVTDIAAIEKTGEQTLRFKLKQPNATFLTATLAKINLIPKHVWEPVLKDLAGKPENAEQLKEVEHDRLGPVQAGALEAHRGDPARALRRPLPGAQDRALDHAHRAQRRGDARHAEARRDQLPRHLRRRSRGAGEVRQGESRHRHPERGRHRLRVRGLQQPPPAVRRREVPPRAVARHRPPADGVGGLAGLRHPGQQPRLAGAELLARSRGRQHEDRPRGGQEDPAGRRLPRWSAASSTTRSASRKS